MWTASAAGWVSSGNGTPLTVCAAGEDADKGRGAARSALNLATPALMSGPRVRTPILESPIVGAASRGFVVVDSHTVKQRGVWKVLPELIVRLVNQSFELIGAGRLLSPATFDRRRGRPLVHTGHALAERRLHVDGSTVLLYRQQAPGWFAFDPWQAGRRRAKSHRRIERACRAL